MDEPAAAAGDGGTAADPGGRGQAESVPSPSARKIKANRKNAQSSTGPRTPEGKARSAQNATKHGLHQTMPAAILRGPFAENAVEIQDFTSSIVKSLNPRNDLESGFATNIAMEMLRTARLGRVEAAFLEKASNRPSVRHQENQSEIDAARDLKSYLEDPAFEKPGDWRQHACDFIHRHTDGWARPTVPTDAPPVYLRRLIDSRWGADDTAALRWVEARLLELEEEHRHLDQWDEGEAAEDLVKALVKILTLSSRSTRNIQRLLAEYGRLQLRHLGDT